MGLSSFTQEQRTYAGETRHVYYRRTGAKGVVLMHELPGITPEVVALAERLVEAGFSVAMPSLFGNDGAQSSPTLLAEVTAKMCVSREFNVFAANGSSPVVDWLRALCIDFHKECGGNGVGAVGLCITGGFALSLTVGTGGVVRAPVMSEPSLPFPLPLTQNSAAIHLSDSERSELAKGGTPVVALRFTNDWICQQARFDTYKTLLGARLETIEVTSPDPAHNIKADAHSVLTVDFQDAPGHPTLLAYARVVEFLQANL
jgi:dienelactone hydrolase